MLQMSDSLTSALISRLILTQVSGGKASGQKTAILNSLQTRLEIALARAGIDCFVVGGITFFASFAALGYSDLSLNLRMSGFSAITTAGLAFFHGMQSQMKHK